MSSRTQRFNKYSESIYLQGIVAAQNHCRTIIRALLLLGFVVLGTPLTIWDVVLTDCWIGNVVETIINASKQRFFRFFCDMKLGSYQFGETSC